MIVQSVSWGDSPGDADTNGAPAPLAQVAFLRPGVGSLSTMEELLLALVVGWAMFTGGLAGACAFARWRLRRRLRIRPELRSGAPTWWLVPSSPSSRLHRRLRRVAIVARTAGAQDAALRPLVADVVDQAVALEAQLLTIARCGRPAAPARRALSDEVARLEGVTARLAANARSRAPGPGYPDPIGDLTDRLAALEAARLEVARIEHGAGLGRPVGVSAGAGRPVG